MKSFHVGVAAEAFAAGLFAQTGCDVSVQYGANQPEYDLLISREDKFLKISVKGSQDGGWGLIQNHKKGRSYHEAIDYWASVQSSKLVYCFVQFKDIELAQCPRVYLARVSEVAAALKKARAGAGSTTLLESWNYKKGIAAGTKDELPKGWCFTSERVLRLLKRDA
jgi:hypothetical protein